MPDRDIVSFDRRSILSAGASLAAMAATGGQAMAQQAAPARSAKKQAEMIAEFVSAYDLAKAPPELVERVRVAFVDTIGVMIGGAHEDVAKIARDMVAEEMSQARATVAGAGELMRQSGTDADVLRQNVTSPKGTTYEALAKLEPVRGADQFITAGNASQITDGAVALLVMTEERASELGFTPIGALLGYAYAGCDPSRMGLGPVFAISKAEEKTGLAYASKVVIIPGYGLAVAQAQHTVRELADELEKKGIEVFYAIHPVAGRMPGHMNVLLAEANIPYEKLKEMDEANTEMPTADVALVVGANDTVNPAAKVDSSSPIYGMPIINADQAGTVVFLKRSMRPGFAGIENELLFDAKTILLFGDAKDTLTKLVTSVANS